jgi:hypothetical protein
MGAILSWARRDETFERHVGRLAWFAALGTCVLLLVGSSVTSRTQLVAAALASMVVIVAVIAVVREAHRYVIADSRRQQVGAARARNEGVRDAVGELQEPINTLLSASLSYTQLVASAPQLSDDVRAHAAQAAHAAKQAVHVISDFHVTHGLANAASVPFAGLPVVAASLCPTGMWLYDPQTRTVRTLDGVTIASVSGELEGNAASVVGAILTAAPEMWDVLGEFQQTASLILSRGRLQLRDEIQLRSALDRVNELNERTRL